MKMFRLFPLELGRLLRSRLTWLVMLLTVLGPVAGLHLYQPAVSTMNSLYLANPAIAGGIAGGILFGLLAILELDRACRSRVDVLVDAVVSPLTAALTRLSALLTTAVLTTTLTMLVWLPISAGRIGAVFDLVDYVLAVLALPGPCPAAGRSGGGVCLPVHPPGGPVPCGICRVLRAEPDCMGGELAAVLAQPLRVGVVR